jgi:hypothetical protein
MLHFVPSDCRPISWACCSRKNCPANAPASNRDWPMANSPLQNAVVGPTGAAKLHSVVPANAGPIARDPLNRASVETSPRAHGSRIGARCRSLVRDDDGDFCRRHRKPSIQFSSGEAYESAFSRHVVPELLRHFSTLLLSRGRRESRVRAAPAVSCAKCTEESAHEHTGPAEAIRLSLRDGFTAYFGLSPVTGFLATVICRSLASANLAPAPGRQDHTTSPSASRTLVFRALRVHRISPQRS